MTHHDLRSIANLLRALSETQAELLRLGASMDAADADLSSDVRVEIFNTVERPPTETDDGDPRHVVRLAISSRAPDRPTLVRSMDLVAGDGGLAVQAGLSVHASGTSYVYKALFENDVDDSDDLAESLRQAAAAIAEVCQ